MGLIQNNLIDSTCGLALRTGYSKRQREFFTTENTEITEQNEDIGKHRVTTLNVLSGESQPVFIDISYLAFFFLSLCPQWSPW